MSFAQGMAAGAAAASGWINSYNRAKNQKWEQEQQDQQRQEWADKRAERTMLQNAAAPVEMREFSGGESAAATMRDKFMGPREDGPAQPLDFNAPMAYQVGSRQFTDQAQAQKYADSQNTPEAQSARAAQGYRSLGKYDKAIALEASDMQRQTQQMQLADMQWKRDLGQAMAGGHEGLAAFGAGTELAQRAGGQIKAVPSADGKTVTYMAVGKDGSTAPIPGLPQFSNDQAGVIQAAYTLDRTITPAARMEHFTQQQERERQQANADRTFYAGRADSDRNYNLNMAQFDAQRTDSDRNYAINRDQNERAGRLADVQLQTAELTLKKAMEENKVPQAVRDLVSADRKELETIGSAIAKAQAEGMWNPENDGAKMLLRRQAVLTEKMSNALRPYIPQQGDKASASPFGIVGDASGARGDKAAGGSFDDALKQEGVTDPKVAAFIKSIHIQESGGGKNTQTSNRGAVGPMQVIPSTFKEMADKGWDINNQSHSTRAGIRYALQAWKESGGDPVLAGAYYYGGPGGMAKARRGVAVKDPKNPKAPDTLQYGASVAARMGSGADKTPKEVDKKAPNRLYDAYLAMARGARNLMPAVDPELTARLNEGLEIN